MKDRIAGLFRRQPTEAKLILYIAVFYFGSVMMYTAGDIKGDYPLILVISGILLHILAYLVWSENNAIKCISNFLMRPKYFKSYKGFIYKSLPIGLLITYTYSFCYDYLRYGSDGANSFSILFFLLTSVPMMIYFFIIGYMKKKYLYIFRINIPIVNYVYLGIILTVIILGGK